MAASWWAGPRGLGNIANVKIQKLDPYGNPVWKHPVVFHEAGYQYFLADLHAADNGSVIVSWVRENGFFSDKQLRANKISASRKKAVGKKQSCNL